MFRQFGEKNFSLFGDPTSFSRQLADQPIGFCGIAEPWFRPALGDATTDRARVDSLPGVVEKGKFPAGLGQATAEPRNLAQCGSRRTEFSVVGRRCLFRCRHSQITLHQITLRMTAKLIVN